MKKYSFKKERDKVLKKVDKIFSKANYGDAFDDDTCDNEIQMKKEVIKHILEGM
jgi:hypothetical protein